MLAMVVVWRRSATWSRRELVRVWLVKRHGTRGNVELALIDEPPGGGVFAEVLVACEARWAFQCEANGLPPLVVCADGGAVCGGTRREVDPDGLPERLPPVGVHERLFQTAPTASPAIVSESAGDRATQRNGVSAGQRGLPDPHKSPIDFEFNFPFESFVRHGPTAALAANTVQWDGAGKSL